MKNAVTLVGLLAIGSTAFGQITNPDGTMNTTTTTTTTKRGFLQNGRFAENPGGLFVLGGVNLANVSRGTDGSTSSRNQLTTWNAGVLGDIPLNEFLSVQPGLMWMSKGSETERNNIGGTGVNFRTEFNPQYLEIPVNLALKIPFGDNSKVNFFVAAGPYAAVGLAGKYETTATSPGGTSVTTKSNIKWNNDDPFTAGQEDADASRLRRFDFGINGSAGFTFGRFMVRGQYGWGLSKLSSVDNANNAANKHRVLSLNLGVRI